MIGKDGADASGWQLRAEAESGTNGPAEGRKRFSISTVNGGHALVSGGGEWPWFGEGKGPQQNSNQRRRMENPQRITYLIGVGTRKQ